MRLIEISIPFVLAPTLRATPIMETTYELGPNTSSPREAPQGMHMIERDSDQQHTIYHCTGGFGRLSNQGCGQPCSSWAGN